MLGELGKISLNDTLCSLSHTGFSFFLLHFKIILEFHIVNQKESAVEVNRSDGELCRVCVSMSMALGGGQLGTWLTSRRGCPGRPVCASSRVTY